MNSSAIAVQPVDDLREARRPEPLPRKLFCVEALGAAGSNLLVTGIYFYTSSQFQWGLKQNFFLAAGQGLFYIVGALSAHQLARRVDPRRALVGTYTVMATLALAALFAARAPVALTCILLVYSLSGSVSWPIMESLVSSGIDSHALSRRISIYNLVWSFVSLTMLAIDGTLIEHWLVGIFLIPVIVHAISAVLMLLPEASGDSEGSALADAASNSAAFTANASAKADATEYLAEGHVPIHDGPEPELLRVRTLALWLSRVALPATYVVIYSLMALMPSLPVMKRLDPATQTLLGSTWMFTRWLTFLVLGLGIWWHTRPRLLLLAAVVMLFAFFGVTLRPSDFFAHGSAAIDVTTMVLAQLALGAALGMIYSGSLYFGMALSEGSTEHGGYHEALIGLGFVLGPGVGAITQTLHPGSVYTGIKAVGSVVFLSVLAVAVTSIIGANRRDREIES